MNEELKSAEPEQEAEEAKAGGPENPNPRLIGR